MRLLPFSWPLAAAVFAEPLSSSLRSTGAPSLPLQNSYLTSCSSLSGSYSLYPGESLKFNLTLNPDSAYYTFGGCTPNGGCDGTYW